MCSLVLSAPRDRQDLLTQGGKPVKMDRGIPESRFSGTRICREMRLDRCRAERT